MPIVVFTHKHTPNTHMYTPHPTNTRIPHPGEGGGHGSESHCQRPNGRVSREHGRRLHVRIETVSSTTSSTLKAPWAARQRGGCGNENDIARSSVAPRTGAGGYTSGARRRCAWTGVGCVAARTQVSFWEEATQARCRLAADAGRSGSGHAIERGSRCERTAARTTRASARAPVASRSSSRVGAEWNQD